MKSEAPSPHLPLLAALFGILALLVLNFTITSLSSPYIVSDLGGDRTITFYLLSFFGFGASISIPLAKPIAFRLGLSKTLILCALIFSAGSLLSALAPTYFWLILCRLLTGMATGPFYPLLTQFFAFLVPSHKKLVIAWVFVTILILAPVVGACWGGVVAYLYDWRFFFTFSSILGFALAALLSFYLKELTIPFHRSKFDWIGWIFYSISILCITFAITTAQQLDWYRSPILIAATLIGIPCFGYYLLRSFYHEEPVIDLHLLAKPIFSLAILSLCVLFAIYFGIILLLAIWLTLDVKFTPLWIAALLGAMGIASLFPRYIIEGRLIRVDPRILIAIATILLAISCFYTATFNVEINFGRIALSRIIAGFGLALFLPPIFQILSQSHPEEKWMDIFELFQGARSLACGLGAAIFSIIWQRRSVFYYERLNEQLNHQSNNLETFFNKIDTLQVPGKPLAQLNTYLSDEASSLALNDVFYLMGWILIALFALITLTFVFKRDLFNLDKARHKNVF